MTPEQIEAHILSFYATVRHKFTLEDSDTDVAIALVSTDPELRAIPTEEDGQFEDLIEVVSDVVARLRATPDEREARDMTENKIQKLLAREAKHRAAFLAVREDRRLLEIAYGVAFETLQETKRELLAAGFSGNVMRAENGERLPVSQPAAPDRVSQE